MASANQTKYDEKTQPVFDPSAGPAADLYTSKYSLGSNYSLVYPKDLESSRKAHAVYFDIYEISPVSFAEVEQKAKNIISGVGNAAAPDASNAEKNVGQVAVETAKAAVETVSNISLSSFVDSGKKLVDIAGNTQVNINPRTKDKSVGTIALYMPETLNFNYEADYNTLSLKEGINSIPLTGKATSGITSMMENSAVKLAMSAAGYVFNPQNQVLFQGIDFRSYEMSFTFTPTSLEETNNVNAIIRSFRYHAAPEIGGIGGFFFTPPSIFNVSFRYGGKTNTNLNLLKKSVLRSVNVNYAPNGWAAFEGNGAPVQTTMTLQFQEIVLVDKNEIKKGF